MSRSAKSLCKNFKSSFLFTTKNDYDLVHTRDFWNAQMPTATTGSIHSVKSKIIQILKEQSFDHAMERDDFLELLRQDAKSGSPLFKQDSLDAFNEARDLRSANKSNQQLGAFFSNKSVVIVPGFMGSQLRDDGPADSNGLIWIDPKIYVTPSQLSALRLAPYDPAQGDVDATPGVHIREDGAVPILYAGYPFTTCSCALSTEMVISGPWMCQNQPRR